MKGEELISETFTKRRLHKANTSGIKILMFLLRILPVLFYLLFPLTVLSQFKIGDNPTDIHPSAILQVESNNQGVLLPRVEDTAISPLDLSPNGMIVYLNDMTSGSMHSGLYVRNNGRWERLAGEQSCWLVTGNRIVDTNAFIGLTGGVPLRFKIDNMLVGMVAEENTALGYGALTNITTAGQNLSIGNLSMTGNTEGNGNVAIGSQTMRNNVLGNYNTVIGFQADVAHPDLQNAMALGNGAVVNASNSIRIGNSAITHIEGQVAWSNPSDARFKEDVREDIPGLAFINRLRPVSFKFNNQKLESHRSGENAHQIPLDKAESRTGFLAQEVAQVCKDLNFDFDGIHTPSDPQDYYTLSYSQFVVPLVKAIQELQQIVDAQTVEMEKLKSIIDAQQSMLRSLQQ